MPNDVTVCLLSRFRDLFERFREQIDRLEPTVDKLLIRSGNEITPPEHAPRWSWEQGREPFIYSRNLNHAWDACAPNDVVVIGDDVLLEEPFIDRLRDCAYNDLTVGIATIQFYGQSPFVACYIRRAVIDAVGPMDERYVGYGKEDMDWCRRMEDLGYHTQCVEGIKAMHTGGTSFWRKAFKEGRQLQSDADVNNALYAEKWKDE